MDDKLMTQEAFNDIALGISRYGLDKGAGKLISAYAAALARIEALKGENYNLKCTIDASHDDAEWNEIEKLEARIAELEAERRWVPVGERLPEYAQTVLFVARHNDTGDKVVNLGIYGQDFMDFHTKVHLPNKFWSVTHWMPVPPAPAAE